MQVPQNILVPTDFSAYGDAAIAYAARLAQRLDATLHLLHVVTSPIAGLGDIGIARANALTQTAQREAQVLLDAEAARLRARVSVGPVRVETGDARTLIELVAQQIDAELIVMGTHGRRGLSRWFLGSIAETVVRTAPCPVLTVHHPANA